MRCNAVQVSAIKYNIGHLRPNAQSLKRSREGKKEKRIRRETNMCVLCMCVYHCEREIESAVALSWTFTVQNSNHFDERCAWCYSVSQWAFRLLQKSTSLVSILMAIPDVDIVVVVFVGAHEFLCMHGLGLRGMLSASWYSLLMYANMYIHNYSMWHFRQYITVAVSSVI